MTDQSLIQLLRLRADLRNSIRRFFHRAGVLEVDVPAIAPAAVTDVHLDAIAVQLGNGRQFLQTSPEYAMKRLLSAGSGPIYSLAYAYRNDEWGRRHRPEFTMLEWYRPGWDEDRLMGEVAQLLTETAVIDTEPVILLYGEVFHRFSGVDPHGSDIGSLRLKAKQVCDYDFSRETRSTCLDAIFSFAVEPNLPSGLVFIKDYPACQSALAKLGEDINGNPVTRRFEAFLDGVEIANGYYELTDPDELRRRFEGDQAQRQAMGKPPMEIDEQFLAAMEQGLPECSGVAMGFDRVLMHLAGVADIARVQPIERCSL